MAHRNGDAEQLKFTCMRAPHAVHSAMQAQRIGPQDCPFSLYDWPAAERRCAPAYNHSAPPGTEQRLPLFELQPGSYFLAAEAAANEGFKLLESEGPG